MLEIRPNCEHCNKDLPNTSTEAMICSFECTYCKDCALNIFENVCPSCSGNLVERPIRPQKEIEENPALGKHIFKPKDLDKARINTNKINNFLKRTQPVAGRYPRGRAIEVFPASPAGGRSFHFDISGQKSKLHLLPHPQSLNAITTSPKER